MNGESSRAGANSLSGVSDHAPSVRHLRWMTRLFTVLLAVFISPATAEAATNRVPSEYTTIQAGINASSHGDTVLVAPGVYKGDGNRDIEFNGRRIVVRSEAGAEGTIIDCEGSAGNRHRGFNFDSASETNEAVLCGFTIRNGYVLGEPGSGNGAGIRIHGNASPVIEDCVVAECVGYSAVYVDSPAAIIRRCAIVNNRDIGADLNRIGLMEECLIEGNGYCGVALVAGELRRSTIAGNHGCGVYIQTNEFAIIRDCLITGNRDIGVRAIYTTGLLIEGCTIVGNDGPVGITGGLRLEDSNQWTTVRRCIVRGNCPNDVQVTTECDVTFECCAIDPSAVTGSGDIMYDGPQVTADPLLCSPLDCEDAPTTAGDYHLQPGSPCLPKSSPCGAVIGALGEGCEVSASPGPQKVAADLSPWVWLETWPNPARDAVSMRLAIPGGSDTGTLDLGTGGESPIEICIFTASGSQCRRVLRTVEQLSSPLEIDTRGLKPGVYFVRMRTANVEASGRFLIAR